MSDYLSDVFPGKGIASQTQIKSVPGFHPYQARPKNAVLFCFIFGNLAILVTSPVTTDPLALRPRLSTGLLVSDSEISPTLTLVDLLLAFVRFCLTWFPVRELD